MERMQTTSASKPVVEKNYCPDCGPVGVSHWAERFSARMDPVLDAATWPMQKFWMGVRPAIYPLKLERLLPYLYQAFAAIRLGTLHDAPDEKNNWRARVIWEEAQRRGIAMHEFRPFGLPREIFWAEYRERGDNTRNGHREIRSFDGLPRTRSASEHSLTWMDDKGVILKKFRAAGVPVPRGGICKTLAEAERMFAEINGRRDSDDSSAGGAGGAVVVKPNLGSRSRHTYVGIADLAALRHAFAKAKELTPYPVVEEELRGYVFRITLVGGKVAGVMRREPPHVIGDGKHTVRELIAHENENPLRHGPIFHELHLDDNAATTLAQQNLSFDAIPVHGQMAILNNKVSRAYGASTTELSEGVDAYGARAIHPDNHELFLKIARVLDDPLVGVDFMIEDMARSWRTGGSSGAPQKCGVIECNSLPFIDLHHYPLRGKPKNVAGMVWDLIWPASSRVPSSTSSATPSAAQSIRAKT